MVRRPRSLVSLAALGLALASAQPAHGYEFWTRARTLGEAYELRGFRVIGGELAIGRQRLTQTLTLVLHDLGDLARKRRRAGRWLRGPVLSWRSTLRFEHDFGTVLTGRLTAGPTLRQDALDLIPELSDRAFALSLLYGHLRVDGLWRDRLSVDVGRIAPSGGDGALPFDGVEVRAAMTERVELQVSGGLAVRDSSWLGVAAYELDGTPGAACHEYEAAAQGQPGRWRLIERGERVVDGRFTSDYERCPQRQVRMPTAQLAVVARQLRGVTAQLGYRVAMSPTAQSLYPSSAPAWGKNLEQVWASAHARWQLRGLTVAPLALARASLAHGVLDRAELSAQVSRGRHQLEPSAAYLLPTFDTDSIWNAFAAEASSELALTYRYDGAWQARAQAWGRRFDAGSSGGAAWAWGGSWELAHGLGCLAGRPLALATRALADTGYGGQRLGLDGELRWAPGPATLTARGAVVWARGDEAASTVAAGADGSTAAGTASARATVTLASGVMAHSLVELRRAASGETALRALGVLEVVLEPNR